MLEQDSVHLVNARKLLRDANEIAPTRAARVAVVGTGTGRIRIRTSNFFGETEGKAIRNSCPQLSHADWKFPADRSDPIDILEASNKGRLPELIPVRYGRMIPSPFVFFRGAAAIMAADLAHTIILP